MRQGKVLVVDDDAATAMLLRAVLEDRGLRVRDAQAGLVACRMIAEDRPDLILLDLMLPDIHGWELCAMIRTLPDPVTATTPIVMVTSRTSEEDKVRGLRLGADDYITKPFTIEEIGLKASRIVERRIQEVGASDAGPPDRTLHGIQGALLGDVKNHLGVLHGFAQRIENGAGDLPPEKVRSYGAFLRKSAELLTLYVDDLLQLGAVETQGLGAKAEPFSLPDVVSDVVAGLVNSAREKGVSLELRVEKETPLVRFGKVAARLCTANLVDNAVRYSPAGSKIFVRVGGQPDGRVRLEVADQGPGLPDHEATRVFDKFFRGEQAQRGGQGSGLGLYIVKALVDSLGGTVSLETRVPDGSRFSLSFPAAERPASGV